jgi:uncharacterized protein with HEPN domain
LPRDDLAYVGHIVDTCQRALRLASGVTRAGYDRDETLRLALTHLIQTIGEAARLKSLEFRNAHPQVPWPAIIGMRHRIIHDYLNVDDDIVWQTVTVELGPLVDVLRPLLEDEGASS